MHEFASSDEFLKRDRTVMPQPYAYLEATISGLKKEATRVMSFHEHPAAASEETIDGSG